MIGTVPEFRTEHIDRHTLSLMQSTEVVYIVTTVLLALTG
jgi:hypothetical protein